MEGYSGERWEQLRGQKPSVHPGAPAALGFREEEGGGGKAPRSPEGNASPAA